MTQYASDFSLEVHAATYTIDISGDLAEDEVGWVAAAVSQLARRSPRCITIDGRGVEDVDATGLDELATLAEHAIVEGSRVVIRNPSPTFRRKLISSGCGFLLAPPQLDPLGF